MRFFTDHFFTEEQKVRILGNTYLKQQEKAQQMEIENRLARSEAEQKKLQQLLEVKRADHFSKLVEVVALAFIIVASFLSWLATPFSPLT